MSPTAPFQVCVAVYGGIIQLNHAFFVLGRALMNCMLVPVKHSTPFNTSPPAKCLSSRVQKPIEPLGSWHELEANFEASSNEMIHWHWEFLTEKN